MCVKLFNVRLYVFIYIFYKPFVSFYATLLLFVVVYLFFILSFVQINKNYKLKPKTLPLLTVDFIHPVFVVKS